MSERAKTIYSLVLIALGGIVYASGGFDGFPGVLIGFAALAMIVIGVNAIWKK